MGQFLMHSLERGRLNTQIDHACFKPSHEDQRSKVPVSGHKEPCLGVRSGQQRLIECSRGADVRSREPVMPCITEKPHGHRIDILVEQASHADAVI